MNLKSMRGLAPRDCGLRLGLAFLAVCCSTLGCANLASDTSAAGCAVAATQVALPSRGVPFDWSHRHVVAANEAAAGAAGQREPRLLYSYLKRNANACAGTTTATTSTHIDWDVPLGASMADGSFPAKYNFSLPGQTPTCSDFVVYGLNTAGTTGGQPNLVGETNLYSGGSTIYSGLCNVNAGVAQKLYGFGATVYAATVKFAYNGSTTAVAGTIGNSISMSLDGLHVAYMESNSTTGLSAFHVVPTTPGTGGPGVLAWSTSGTVLATAVAPPSITTVPSSGSWSAADSYSSIWVDYTNDLAYVGTDNGVLHKIQNVFCSTVACKASPVAPSEVTTSPWPLTLSGAGALTSPVEDAKGVIYVAGANGYLYAVSSAGVLLNKSNQAFTAGSIVDGPILDVDNSGTTQALYWFSSSSPALPNPQMVQTGSTLNIASGNTFSLLLNAPAGQNSWGGTTNMHSGTFDNGFYTARNGNMWACGWYQDTIYGSNGNQQGIVRFGINGTTVTEDTSKVYATISPEYLASTVNECAPLSEVLDSAGVDHLFVSNQDGLPLATGSCIANAACVAGFTIGSSGSPATWSLTNTGSYNLASSHNNSAPYNASTSGIVVDNTVDPTSKTCGTGTQTCGQTASMYFNYGVDAIKLTQSALQ